MKKNRRERERDWPFARFSPVASAIEWWVVEHKKNEQRINYISRNQYYIYWIHSHWVFVCVSFWFIIVLFLFTNTQRERETGIVFGRLILVSCWLYIGSHFLYFLLVSHKIVFVRWRFHSLISTEIADGDGIPTKCFNVSPSEQCFADRMRVFF